MNKTIVFSKNAKKDILNALNKEIDKEGYIIDKTTQKRVVTQEGEEITLEEFGGFRKGSEIFTKSDIISLIKFYDRLK